MVISTNWQISIKYRILLILWTEEEQPLFDDALTDMHNCPNFITKTQQKNITFTLATSFFLGLSNTHKQFSSLGKLAKVKAFVLSFFLDLME